jgi:integrase
VVRKSQLQWTEAPIDDEGNSKGNGQRCSGSDSKKQGKNVTKGISDSQEERRMEKDPGLHPHKYLFQGHQIQDGRCKVGSANIKSEYVVSQFGYKSSLSSYQSKRRIKGLLMLQVQQPTLSLHRHAVRYQDGTSYFFKNYASLHGSSASSVECRSSPIHRRYLGWPYGQRVSGKISRRDSRFFKKVRMVNKYGEIGLNTAESIPVFRMAVEFNGDDSGTRGEEGTQSKAVGTAVDTVCQEGKDSFNKDIGFGDRQIISNEAAVLHSQSLSCRTESAKGTCSKGEFVERSGEIGGSDFEGSIVVEEQVEGKCSDVVADVHPRGRALDRCIPRGVGGTCSVQISGQSTNGDDGARILEKYVEFQSERVDGGERGALSLSECRPDKGDSSLASSHGQLHNSLQHQQESRELQFGSTDERVVQLLGPVLNDDQSDTRERSGEFKGGQSVENEQVGGLQFGSYSTPPSLADFRSTDICGSVRIEAESSAQSVLHPIEQGQFESGERCLQHLLEGKGDTLGSPPSSSAVKMLTKDKEREDKGNSSGPTLAGAGVDTDFKIDDSEDDSDGRVEVIIAPRKVDGKESGQITSRFTSGVFSGRRNDEGQQMVLALLSKKGLSDVSDWFFRSVAESTWRNYRRGFTLFSRLLKKAGVDPLSIENVDMAVASLIRAFKVACELKIRLSAIFLMKTAVIRLFSFIFNVDLSHMPMVTMALRCFTLSEMPRREMLRLQWSVDQLLIYMMKLPSFEVMEFNQLTAVAIVLCMAFTALRFSEMYNLDVKETSPDIEKNEWKFWVHIKGHDFREPVVLHRVNDSHLDPLRALWTLRSRLHESLTIKGKEPVSFWYKFINGNYVLLSYDGVRAAAVQVLQLAGINEKKPYHIKHAVLTCLHESGVSAKDIAAFARHRFESMAAYYHYISYDAGKMSVRNIAERVSKINHPN